MCEVKYRKLTSFRFPSFHFNTYLLTSTTSTSAMISCIGKLLHRLHMVWLMYIYIYMPGVTRTLFTVSISMLLLLKAISRSPLRVSTLSLFLNFYLSPFCTFSANLFFSISLFLNSILHLLIKC